MERVNIIKRGGRIVVRELGGTKERNVSSVSFRIGKDEKTGVVGIYTFNTALCVTKMENITIQNGNDGAPEQLTPSNWDDLTDGLSDSKGGAGGGDADGKIAAHNTSPVAHQGIRNELANKVEKIAGMGLSANDFTNADNSKLGGIEAGAQKNVKSNWNAPFGGADEILNKPLVYTQAQVNALLAQIDTAEFRRPVASVGLIPQPYDSNDLYLVDDGKGEDSYDVYILMPDEDPEDVASLLKIGNTSIKLADYYSKAESQDHTQNDIDAAKLGGVSAGDISSFIKFMRGSKRSAYSTPAVHVDFGVANHEFNMNNLPGTASATSLSELHPLEAGRTATIIYKNLRTHDMTVQINFVVKKAWDGNAVIPANGILELSFYKGFDGVYYVRMANDYR